MTTTTGTTCVESETFKGAYDFSYCAAIVIHEGQRLFIHEGWGGGNVEGESYRWEHGMAWPAEDGKTLRDAIERCDYYNQDAVPHEWSGRKIRRIATAAGLC